MRKQFNVWKQRQGIQPPPQFEDADDFKTFIDTVLQNPEAWGLRKHRKFRKAVTAWKRACESKRRFTAFVRIQF